MRLLLFLVKKLHGMYGATHVCVALYWSI